MRGLGRDLARDVHPQLTPHLRNERVEVEAHHTVLGRDRLVPALDDVHEHWLGLPVGVLPQELDPGAFQHLEGRAIGELPQPSRSGAGERLQPLR